MKNSNNGARRLIGSVVRCTVFSMFALALSLAAMGGAAAQTGHGPTTNVLGSQSVDLGSQAVGGHKFMLVELGNFGPDAGYGVVGFPDVELRVDPHSRQDRTGSIVRIDFYPRTPGRKSGYIQMPVWKSDPIHGGSLGWYRIYVTAT